MEKLSSDSHANLHDINSVKAKVIILGDSDTGKTHLIENLDSHKRTENNRESDAKTDVFFSIVEISSAELDNATSDVYLKIWEHSVGSSKQEEELACRGALICIITLDIRNPTTANSAFNKWLLLKETYMTECFLFVVGTHLDMAIQRRVQIKDICKACAMKDATYIELSNVDGTNMDLLRRLINQRLIYMLQRRDVINSILTSTNGDFNAEVEQSADNLSDNDDEEEEEENELSDPLINVQLNETSTLDEKDSREYAEEGKNESEIGPSEVVARPVTGEVTSRKNKKKKSTSGVRIAALEQNVLSHSVGAVLASYLGTESWPGFEAQEESLAALGREMSTFVDQLASGDHVASLNNMQVDEAYYAFDSPASTGLDSVRGSGRNKARKGRSHPSNGGSEDDASSCVDAGHSMAELRMAFEIMGLSLPKALSLVSAAAQQDAELNFSYDRDEEVDGLNGTPSRKNKSMSYLRKMRVRLPDGSSADMVLDLESNIEQQIELFLLSNSMGDDDEARAKLVQTLYQIREEYYVSIGISQGFDSHSGEDQGGSPEHHSEPQTKNGTPPHSGGKQAQSANVHHAINLHSNGDFDTQSHSGSNNHTPRLVGTANNNNKSIARYKATKRCKLRIAIPGAGQVEVVLAKGEDLSETAEAIRSQHRLSQDLKQRVYEQLVKAFY